jgi:hypothetical protein
VRNHFVECTLFSMINSKSDKQIQSIRRRFTFACPRKGTQLAQSVDTLTYCDCMTGIWGEWNCRLSWILSLNGVAPNLKTINCGYPVKFPSDDFEFSISVNVQYPFTRYMYRSFTDSQSVK